MSFWSGEKLAARGDAIFVPYNPAQVDRNAYVLRMGDRYFRTADQEQAKGTHQVRTLLKEKEAFVIPPGQFAFLVCKEEITVPENAMALISMRTPLKFRGLINVSGFHVDPGYKGKLVYAVFNASPSPIQIKEDDPTFKIWFCDLDHENNPRVSQPPYIAKANDGHYDISNEMIHGMSGEILSLQSLAKKIQDYENSVEKRFAEQKPTVDNLYFIFRSFVISVFLAIMIPIWALLFPPMWELGKFLAPETAAWIKTTLHLSSPGK